MNNNILLIDSDYDEAEGFVRGLEEETKSSWTIELYQNNVVYGIRRYMKFFLIAWRTVFNRKKYKGATLLCWQQFYGICIAFFCRLLHVKRMFSLIIMTFIYKPKAGFVGKLYRQFIKYSITSQCVDGIILTSQNEIDMYADEFGLNKSKFWFVPCGAIAYNPHDYDNDILKNKNYYFSTGRSNRDYDFLIHAFENTEYHLVIACDKLKTRNDENIEIHNDLFNEKMLTYMRNARAVVIALDNDQIAAGQLVLLHAMNMEVPVIITKSHGVTDDYVIDGYNGLVIEKNTKDLLAALNKIENNPELYRRLCCNGRKEFEEKYTYYAVGKEVGKIIKNI